MSDERNIQPTDNSFFSITISAENILSGDLVFSTAILSWKVSLIQNSKM